MTGIQRSVVLFMPEGSILAHVGRTVAIANAMDPNAFDIRFAASGAHADKIDPARWPVVPVYTQDRNELLRRLKTGGSAFTVEELREYVKDERRVLSEIKPSVVVGDFRPSLGISAPSLGIRYVGVTNAVWTQYCSVKFDPPASWRLTRIFGARSLKFLRSVMPGLEKRIYAHYAAPFNTVRREYGIPELPDIRECMCSESLNLVADLEELFPHVPDMPQEHYQYVGPLMWESNAPAPDWLAKLDRGRPIVYLTMGSTGPLEQIHAILKGLADNEFQVICTTATETVRELPPGCYAAPFAPGKALCEVASVVVCHAGNGTIYQALSCGKPIVGVPEFHDQEFNMQRVQALGLGVRADSKDDVIRQVQKILRDPAFALRAQNFSKKNLTLWDGAANAARWIETVACPEALRRGAHGIPSPARSRS
ncbi:MAG: nucleotide disphospho-sugar-binding domain-containing protein [Candidatus Brocadiia bacterium]